MRGGMRRRGWVGRGGGESEVANDEIRMTHDETGLGTGARCCGSVDEARGSTEVEPVALDLQVGVLARVAQTVRSSVGSTGLGTWIWKPARRACWRSSERAKAVRATAGVLPPWWWGSARTFRMRS